MIILSEVCALHSLHALILSLLFVLLYFVINCNNILFIIFVKLTIAAWRNSSTSFCVITIDFDELLIIPLLSVSLIPVMCSLFYVFAFISVYKFTIVCDDGNFIYYNTKLLSFKGNYVSHLGFLQNLS